MKNPRSFFKTLLGLIFILTIGVLLGGVYYWLQLNNESSELSKKEITIANFAEKERALDNLLINYNDIKDKINKINYAIPKEKEAASLMASLETLAHSKGLEIVVYEHKEDGITKKSSTSQSTDKGKPKVNHRMNQVEKEDGLLKFSPEITVTGSYIKVNEFLSGLEDLDRLLVIDKIDIQKEPNPDTPDFVRAVITTYAYFK